MANLHVGLDHQPHNAAKRVLLFTSCYPGWILRAFSSCPSARDPNKMVHPLRVPYLSHQPVPSMSLGTQSPSWRTDRPACPPHETKVSNPARSGLESDLGTCPSRSSSSAPEPSFAHHRLLDRPDLPNGGRVSHKLFSWLDLLGLCYVAHYLPVCQRIRILGRSSR